MRRRGSRATRAEGGRGQSELARWAIADLRLAAWFLWITPLLAALSSSRDALRSRVVADAASPESAASRKLRTAVFNSDFTALLRRRAASFCPLRLICDLMLATREFLDRLGL